MSFINRAKVLPLQLRCINKIDPLSLDYSSDPTARLVMTAHMPQIHKSHISLHNKLTQSLLSWQWIDPMFFLWIFALCCVIDCHCDTASASVKGNVSDECTVCPPNWWTNPNAAVSCLWTPSRNMDLPSVQAKGEQQEAAAPESRSDQTSICKANRTAQE